MASKIKKSVTSQRKTSNTNYNKPLCNIKNKAVTITQSEFELLMETEWKKMRKKSQRNIQKNDNNSTERMANTAKKSYFYTIPFKDVNNNNNKNRKNMDCGNDATEKTMLCKNKVYTKEKSESSVKRHKVKIKASSQQALVEDLSKYNVKSKGKYASMSIDPLPQASLQDRWAHRIRLAVSEGGSTSLHDNESLRDVILKALEDNVSWHHIERTLDELGVLHRITKNCFLLQVRILDIVDVVCLVRTKHILQLKRQLMPLFKKYGAVYSSVLHNFNHCCVIEAIASYRTPIHFCDFERTLSKDALDCHATGVEILDYETGAVHMKCHPLQLPDVCEALEQRNYKILYSDYGLRPRHYVELESEDCKFCMEFLKVLGAQPGIERLYDNISPKCQETKLKLPSNG